MNQTIIINDKKFIKEQSLSRIETFKHNSFFLFLHTNSQFFHVLDTKGILLQTKTVVLITRNQT